MGRLPETALAVQNSLRSLGYRATTFALTNDPEGDARLVALLSADHYDGVVIGGYINGQDREHPASPASYLWFTRVLNIVHEYAPGSKIILSRKPGEAAEACGRVVGSASASVS
jgi:hypothetical protein